MPSRCRDLLRLALAAAWLGLGGGVGCDPVLAGADFRPANVPFDPEDEDSAPDWYMAFTGKKAPGDGLAELPFSFTPPFGVEARLGVFDAERVAASDGAEVCAGFAEAAAETRVCVTTFAAPLRSVVSSNLDGNTRECAGDRTVEVEIDDDGVTRAVNVRCPDEAVTVLASAPSAYEAGESWRLFFAAQGLAPRAQLGFDNLEIENKQPGIGQETPLSLVFDAFLLNLEAFDRVEHDESGAFSLTDQASGIAIFALNKTPDGDPLAKLIEKGLKTRGKLASGLGLGGAKYLKGFPKLAAIDADTLEAGESAP